MRTLAAASLACALVIAQAQGQTPPASPSLATFTNPLLPGGPDPWVIFHDGFYYYMNTTGGNLIIWKTRSIGDLKTAPQKIVWTRPLNGPASNEVWAPELHYLENKWYIYFTADAGNNRSHRVWVLENPSADPTEGDWTMKGKLSDRGDHWAIDPSVFEDQGKLYLIWSGWPDDEDGEQDIYIASLKNPWTMESRRVLLSKPKYRWEKYNDLAGQSKPDITVNEGPEMLKHGDKLFLVYSASACWSDHYELGLLTAVEGSNLLKKSSWKKSPNPVFVESPQAKAFGPGHNGFFRSPDGKQDWIIYHANPGPNQDCGLNRSPRAQPFTWNSDGTPHFGEPVAIDQPIERPSGEVR